MGYNWKTGERSVLLDPERGRCRRQMLKILYAVKKPHDEIMTLLSNHYVDLMPPDQQFEGIVSKKNYDLILLEKNFNLISKVKEVDPRTEIILFGRESTNAIEMIKRGAFAFFRLPFIEQDRFNEILDVISELVRIRTETGALESQLHDKYTFGEVVGKNFQMLELFNFMRRIAPYFTTVTILGETGTGKETLAKTLHSISPAAKFPFLSVNCGALSSNLIESELFGHKKGSFTGAISDKVGMFEAAGEGIIFLDEIGELPLAVQPHLLRVLQDGEFRPIGSNQLLMAKCRIIAATNKDLAIEVKKGHFREDLYYRLTPLIIKIPPLRDRKDDMPILSRHFLKRFSDKSGKKVYGISRPAQAALFSFDWPGNVRMLQNVLEHAAIMTTETFIRLQDVPPEIRKSSRQIGEHYASLESVIKQHIETVLSHCNGNRSKTAEKLQISRRALHRKIEKYNIR
jgi:DNA-binding NtrC family response regulator